MIYVGNVRQKLELFYMLPGNVKWSIHAEICQTYRKGVGHALPKPPRLCQTELPNMSKYDAVVINAGTEKLISSRFWEMDGTYAVSHEPMLARVNDQGESFKRSWVSVFYINMSVILKRFGCQLSRSGCFIIV